MRLRWKRVIGAVASIVACAAAMAQSCDPPGWLPGDGMPGIGGTLYETNVYETAVWDPDGPGPRTPLVVLDGNFNFAGNRTVNNIATYDPATGVWGTLGSGITPLSGYTVPSFIRPLPDGRLVVGGLLETVGGITVNYITIWNGTQWTALGSPTPGTSGPVVDAVYMPNGDLVVCGSFTSAGGIAANRVARWNGTNWSPMSVPDMISIGSLAVLTNGDLIAAGSRTPGASIAHVMRWDGAQWNSFPSISGERAYSIAPLPNNSFAVVSYTSRIQFIPPMYSIQRWNGSSWSSLGSVSGFFSPPSPYQFSVSGLISRPNGNLYLFGGLITSVGGTTVRNIAQWTGSGWADLGGGAEGDVTSMSIFSNGNLLLAGSFGRVGTTPASGVATWNGSQWSRFGRGFDRNVSDMALMPNGEIVACGHFQTAGNATVNRVTVSSNGIDWRALGSGLTYNPTGIFYNPVYASYLLPLPNGDLIVTGNFNTAGSQPAPGLARWNGTSWSTMGTPMSAPGPLARSANGTIFLGGQNGSSRAVVQSWIGASWVEFGNSIPPSGSTYDSINAMTFLANGDLIVAGEFDYMNGVECSNVARWNGTTWSPVGNRLDSSVTALLSMGYNQKLWTTS